MIKLVAMDIDGTLTDGGIYISPSGELFKHFNVKDGFGIAMLAAANIPVVIITGRSSEIVNYRASELAIKEVCQQVKFKDIEIQRLAKKYNLNLDEIAFIGDDLNDLPALKIVGLSACPNDAVEQVRNHCDIVSIYNGGEGAVRDIIEHILKQNNLYEKTLSSICKNYFQ